MLFFLLVKILDSLQYDLQFSVCGFDSYFRNFPLFIGSFEVDGGVFNERFLLLNYFYL